VTCPTGIIQGVKQLKTDPLGVAGPAQLLRDPSRRDLSARLSRSKP